MNFIRAQVCRCGMAQGHVVKLGAIGKFPDASIVIRSLRLILQKGDQLFVSWLDRIGQRALCLVGQVRSRRLVEFLQSANFLLKSASNGLSVPESSNGAPPMTL